LVVDEIAATSSRVLEEDVLDAVEVNALDQLDIWIEKVSYKYPSASETALGCVSLATSEGSGVAIVSGSGANRSTPLLRRKRPCVVQLTKSITASSRIAFARHNWLS
jgi:ABC-type transport system involved in cytochrome bd biosynthesis fused ATPase/permease subunit